MAHFARIDNGVVMSVIVVNNDVLDPADEEGSGQLFLSTLYPGSTPSEFVQTSYTGSMRGKYAGIGDIWDGNGFTSPAIPDIVQAAYARGKADGSAEALLSMQSVTE